MASPPIVPCIASASQRTFVWRGCLRGAAVQLNRLFRSGHLAEQVHSAVSHPRCPTVESRHCEPLILSSGSGESQAGESPPLDQPGTAAARRAARVLQRVSARLCFRYALGLMYPSSMAKAMPGPMSSPTMFQIGEVCLELSGG